MSSVITLLFYTFLFRGKYKKVSSFASRGPYVYTLVKFTSGSIQLELK